MVTWEVHYARTDERGVRTDYGVYTKRYKRKGYAIRMARQMFGHLKDFYWWLVGVPDDEMAPIKMYTE